MRVRLHPAARAEFLEAIRHYEQQVPGLGSQFLREVQSTVARLLAQPRSAPAVRGEFRRMGLRRFPYGIIYRVFDEEIRVSAIAHRRRRPDYWARRTVLK
jgi:toxin ParE1/3/4